MEAASSSAQARCGTSPATKPAQHAEDLLSQEQQQQAFQDIAEEDKAAYTQALREVPELVETETPFERFLATESDQNPHAAAARRLCRYWRERVDIFRERAFRPMTQVCNGALTEQDVELLNTTAFVILPPDARQRTTVAIDISRLGSKYNYQFFLAAKLRFCFYVLHVATENPISQSVGVAAIGIRAAAPDTELSKRCISLIRHALPIRCFEYHIVFLPSRLKEMSLSNFVEQILSEAYSLLGFFSRTAFVHRGKSDQDVIRNLVACGFQKRSLPTWIGGTWTVKNFRTWQKKRIRIEEERVLNEEEKKERVRKSNAIRSKMKRERNKQELDSLQEKKRILQTTNKSLEQTNQYFQGLLEYAQKEIAVLSEFAHSGQVVPERPLNPVHLPAFGPTVPERPPSPLHLQVDASVAVNAVFPTLGDLHGDDHRPPVEYDDLSFDLGLFDDRKEEKESN